MSDCLCAGSGGGGAKAITLDDCKIIKRQYGNVIQLPAGVTWLDIDTMVCSSVDESWGGANRGSCYKSKGDEHLKFPRWKGYSINSNHQPLATDNEIYVFGDDNQSADYPSAMIATLK